MPDPLAPWARFLTRLDGVYHSSSGRTYRPSKLREPLPPPKPEPSETDPFHRLPATVLADIVRYIEPIDVVRSQRVSRKWKSWLASEYIATLALKAHFPESEETERCWRLHRMDVEEGGEEYPEVSVTAYRRIARRWAEENNAGAGAAVQHTESQQSVEDEPESQTVEPDHEPRLAPAITEEQLAAGEKVMTVLKAQRGGDREGTGMRIPPEVISAPPSPTRRRRSPSPVTPGCSPPMSPFRELEKSPLRGSTPPVASTAS